MLLNNLLSLCRSAREVMRLCIFILALLFHPMVWGAVSLNVTRIIIDHGDKEANVRISNKSGYPVLIQGWIDTGDANLSPEKIQVPFVITSPMFRLGPEVEQNLRIIFTGKPQTLAEDRESVFWLNVQEIPQNLFVTEGENHMQIAFRTRIKLFYRPLSIPQNTDSLHEQLEFRLRQENGQPVLYVRNPTPIHASILEINLGSRDTSLIQISPEESMVAPFGTLKLPLSEIGRLDEGNTNEGAPVSYFFLNDFGVSMEKKTRLIASP